MAAERVPWLEAVPATGQAAPAAPRGAVSRLDYRRPAVLGGAALLLAGVAGAAFWLGTLQPRGEDRSAPRAGKPSHAGQPVAAPSAPASPAPAMATAVAPILPVPVAEAPPAPVGALARVRETERVLPMPVRSAEIVDDVAPPRLSNRVRARLKQVRREAKREEAAQLARAHTPAAASLPDTRFALVPPGPAGRIVQLGTFRLVSDAQEQWRAVAARWPYLTTKPRILSPVWVREGRQWALNYRLQVGTASQAQSLVICQRLGKAGQPCVVVY